MTQTKQKHAKIRREFIYTREDFEFIRKLVYEVCGISLSDVCLLYTSDAADE